MNLEDFFRNDDFFEQEARIDKNELGAELQPNEALPLPGSVGMAVPQISLPLEEESPFFTPEPLIGQLADRAKKEPVPEIQSLDGRTGIEFNPPTIQDMTLAGDESLFSIPESAIQPLDGRTGIEFSPLAVQTAAPAEQVLRTEIINQQAVNQQIPEFRANTGYQNMTFLDAGPAMNSAKTLDFHPAQIPLNRPGIPGAQSFVKIPEVRFKPLEISQERGERVFNQGLSQTVTQGAPPGYNPEPPAAAQKVDINKSEKTGKAVEIPQEITVKLHPGTAFYLDGDVLRVMVQ